MPRTSVKGQVLADLIAEFAEPPIEVIAEEQNMNGKLVVTIFAQDQRGFGVGLVLISPEKIIIEKLLRLGFLATNNEAKYETFLHGMVMVQKIGGKAMEVFSNSRLVVGQVKGELEARDVRM